MGSNPTPRTYIEPIAVFNDAKLVEFGLWLLRKGNRESTVQRKLKYLKKLNHPVENMFSQVLAKNWSEKSKECALETVRQYAEFLGLKVQKPKFRAYNNTELYVPTPSMIKQLIYRIRNLQLRACVIVAVETGASASEVCVLKMFLNLINLVLMLFKKEAVTLNGWERKNTYCI